MATIPRPTDVGNRTDTANQPATQAGTVRPAAQQLTPDEVVALCWNMSNNKAKATTAAAVILAESSGNTAARCYNRRSAGGTVVCGAPGPGPGGTGGGVLSIDRGLCQFNSVSHPELTDADCDDPRKAVSAMWHLSHGFVDFHEWATYTSGTYRRYLPITTSAWDAVNAKGPGAWTQLLSKIGGAFVAGGTAAGSVAGGVVSATMSVGEFLANLSNPAVWRRVLFVVVGLIGLVVGAFLLDRSLLNQVAGTAVTNVAGAVASSI